MKKDRFPFIFVNTNHSKGRQQFSLWHEVYHHYMNHKMGLVILIISHWKREKRKYLQELFYYLMQKFKMDGKYDDIMRPDVIARMSVHYQISFGAAMVRAMQLNPIPRDTYQQLNALSRLDHKAQLYAIYTGNDLPTDILEPTNNTQISSNIMTVLEHNYNKGLVSGAKINEIIDKIEVLNYD